jgi:hypothetical protein
LRELLHADFSADVGQRIALRSTLRLRASITCVATQRSVGSASRSMPAAGGCSGARHHVGMRLALQRGLAAELTGRASPIRSRCRASVQAAPVRVSVTGVEPGARASQRWPDACHCSMTSRPGSLPSTCTSDLPKSCWRSHCAWRMPGRRAASVAPRTAAVDSHWFGAASGRPVRSDSSRLPWHS